MENRHAFFVLHESGEGGVWTLITADSEESILAHFPDAAVYRELPSALSPDMIDVIRKSQSFDIDDPTPDWLTGASGH